MNFTSRPEPEGPSRAEPAGALGKRNLEKRRYMLLLQQAPWLLNGGAVIRNYWMAVALAKAYRLDLIIAEQIETPAPDDFAAACNSITCFPKPEKTAYEIRRALSALDPQESYFTAGQVSAAQRAFAAKLASENEYQAIQIGDLNQQGSLPARHCPPIWYDAHNCEAELVRRQAAFEPFPLRQIVEIDAMRVKRIESNIIARARWVTTCTDQDMIDLAEFAPAILAKGTMIPSGVEVARYASVREHAPDDGCLLLSGSFNWRPTQQGLLWFVDKVLPLLPDSVDGTTLRVRIAGRMTTALIAQLSANRRLELSPNPPDMRPELAQAQVVVVPVLASSGVRVRIYEAWAAGRPVVTTPSGALGLNYCDGDELVARASPDEFAEGVVRMVRDRALWNHVRETGLARVVDFDWPRIVDRIVALHKHVFSN
jgi:glycosyltransferase involved in cell wall biosynthesis